MANTKTIRAAVLGASGYTGADMIRLAALHPAIKLTALIAKGHAGQRLAQVFPHLASLDAPKLVTSDEVNWDDVDVVFCGLPHGTAHAEIAKLPKRIKIIDMSADFRLRDPKLYAEWYANEHSAPELIKDAVYGLTEHYRDKIRTARLVACPGCYPTAVLLALLPLAKAKLIAARRHHHRCQVRRLRRRSHAEAEHSVFGGGRGALALRHRQSPPRAGDRAGARTGLRHCRHHQLHAASCADVARRALHLLCAARRQGVARGSPQGARQRLMRIVPSCASSRRA